MAIARMIQNPTVTQEQYDAMVGQLGVTSANPPDGAMLHFAGRGPDGRWWVVEVWESEEAAHKWDEEHLLPLMRQVGVERPAPVVWPVHNLITRQG